MIKVNDNFRKLSASYLFSEVARKIASFKSDNGNCNVIRMDIGDVTIPMLHSVVAAMHEAVDELALSTSFRGYGPEQGYPFLRNLIAEHDYAERGLAIDASDIFISDGAKSDLANLGDIYSRDCIVAVMNPSYPVYVDDSVIDGRAGEFVGGRWNRLMYLDCNSYNDFVPDLPKQKADIIFLCFPNNPTGEGITKTALSKWVEYARENGSVIIYDSAYEAFVRERDIVRSVYEIDGADEVAIEVRSFSKTAGFTGVRCGYTVVPHKLKGRFADGSVVDLNSLWNRRQTTMFNGASYISQKGAAAIYTPAGKKDVKAATDYYIRNARIIKESLQKIGFCAYGGVNSPYVWASPGDGRNSWEIFESLLQKYHFSSTPGSGFGQNGEGFVRLTGFNSLKNTQNAMQMMINA